MDKNEIFSFNHQPDRMPKLIKLLRSGTAILFVGAGSSKRVGYPDWQDLLKKIEKTAIQCAIDFKPNDREREYKPLEYAEYIKQQISSKEGSIDNYYAQIYTSFDEREFLPGELDFHATLLKLPFKGIVTTNYDAVLENAIKCIKNPPIPSDSYIIHRNSAGEAHKFFLSLNDRKKIGVAHLHGFYKNPEGIILSSQDYKDSYDIYVNKKSIFSNSLRNLSYLILGKDISGQISSNWTLHRKFLWSVLATHRVIFIGFSLMDPYFNNMLKIVSDDLWIWDKPIHFAIMSISPETTKASKTLQKAEKLKRDYGIETLFYTDTDGTHKNLENFVYNIAKELNVEIQSSTISPEETPEETNNNRKKLDKVKELSQKLAGKSRHGN